MVFQGMTSGPHITIALGGRIASCTVQIRDHHGLMLTPMDLKAWRALSPAAALEIRRSVSKRRLHVGAAMKRTKSNADAASETDNPAFVSIVLSQIKH